MRYGVAIKSSFIRLRQQLRVLWPALDEIKYCSQWLSNEDL